MAMTCLREGLSAAGKERSGNILGQLNAAIAGGWRRVARTPVVKSLPLAVVQDHMVVVGCWWERTRDEE